MENTKPRKVALDVDGVIANFYKALCLKYNKPYVNSEWDVPWFPEYAKELRDDKVFWETLPILNAPEKLTFNFDLYLTAIPKSLKKSRGKWLKDNKYPDKPVIVSSNKLVKCIKEGITALVDDKITTLLSIDRYNKRAGKEIIKPIFYKPPYLIVNESIPDTIYQIQSLSEVNNILNE